MLNILVFIFVCNLAIGCIYFANYYYKLYKNESMYEKLRNTAVQDNLSKMEDRLSKLSAMRKGTSTKLSAMKNGKPTKLSAARKKKSTRKIADTKEEPILNIDFSELTKLNKDIYAWVCIPNTKVDYPVLQHPTNDQYYLNYNIDGSKGYPGCIYSEKCNSKDFTDNVTILYGHNMKNGTMFGSLQNYKNNDYLYNNRFIYIFTSDKSLTYEVIMASEYDNRHIIGSYQLNKEEEISSFINTIPTNAAQKEKIEKSIASKDHFLILSTCTKTGSSKRFLVIAKEVK